MVRKLGGDLRDAGIEVVLDQFFEDENPAGPDEQWGPWSVAQVKEADRVLMIGSPSWFRCYERKEDPGTGLGAAAEIHVIQAELYQSKYVTAKHRLVFLDESVATDDVPLEIRTMKKFRPNRGGDDLQALVRWLGSESKAETEVEELGVCWPGPDENFKPQFANRRKEWPLLESLLTSGDSKRALFVEAPGSHGKSKFLQETHRYCKSLGLRTLYVDFKNDMVGSLQDLLREIGLRFGETFPEFCKNGSKDPYDLRHELRQQTEPMVMIFDTWEKLKVSSGEIVKWLENQLIPELDQCPAVRLIVGGQSVPRIVAPDDGHCGHVCLGPIKCPDEWEEWLSSRYPGIVEGLENGEVKLSTLILASSGGIPGIMCTLLAATEQSLKGGAA